MDYLLCDVTVFLILFFFFFQAEDGIRDLTVTGVQTCALPIFRSVCTRLRATSRASTRTLRSAACPTALASMRAATSAPLNPAALIIRTCGRYKECAIVD